MSLIKADLVILDLDDTLVDTSAVFWKARSAFVSLTRAETGLSEQAIIDKFEEIDSEHIILFGVDPGRYLKTMQRTYRELTSRASGKRGSEREIAACGEIIRTEFPALFPGAIELLDWAAERFQLVLVTRGSYELQNKKLFAAGLQRYFSLVEIVADKNAATFEKVMKDAGGKPAKTWVIGDSVKSDINPAILAGARCIQYLYEHPHYHWQQEHNEKPVGPFYRIRRLPEAKLILAGKVPLC